MGACGELIDIESSSLKSRFSDIFKTAKSGQSVVVNVIIGRTDFRNGSISL